MLSILMAHNRYRVPGGEDQSTLAEAAMLRAGGHDVDVWQVSNDTIEDGSAIRNGLRAVWSAEAAREIAARLDRKRYDILHVQNHFPQLSPVIHRVAAARGVATVQHLRNFRTMCVNAAFFRDGYECRDCSGSLMPWRGVLRGCYRESALASLAPAAMVAVHKAARTFTQSVDAYIAISQHVRSSHRDSGLPLERVHVRYNTVDAGEPPAARPRQRSIVAPGRLSPEKGQDLLIAAWQRRPRPDAVLHIAGSGPDEARLRTLAGGDPSILMAGQVPFDELRAQMARACAVVNASVWSEPFGRTPMEAFSVGTPAIVSRAGGMPEIVQHGINGLVVEPGDVDGLDQALTAMLRQDDRHAAFCAGACARFAELFSPAVILPQTEAIYRAAMARRKRLSAGAAA